MPFNLFLAQQAASLCRDQPTASPEYAQALGVQQNVLDAQLAMLVDATPNDPQRPTSATLTPPSPTSCASASASTCSASRRGPSPWRSSVPSLGELASLGGAA